MTALLTFLVIISASDSLSADTASKVLTPFEMYQILWSNYLELSGKSDSALKFLQSTGALKLQLELLLKENQPDSVIRLALDALSKKPDREIWFYLIQAYYLKGDYRSAEEELRKLLSTYPNDPNVKAFAGRVYANIGKPDTAIQFLKEALSQLPDSTSLLRALGLSFLLAGQPDSAVSYLEQYYSTLMEQEEDYGLMLALATAYEKLGKLEEAAQYYANYIDAVGYADLMTARHLAEIYRQLGKCDNVIKIDSVIVRFMEFDPRIYKTLAECYESTGDLHTAFLYAAAAVRIDPKDAAAHYLLARIAYEMWNLELALDETRQAVKLDKKNEDYRVLEAMIYLLMDRPQKAYKIARKLKNNPRAAWVCYYVKFQHDRDIKKALKWIEKAYKLSPTMTYGLGYASLLDSVGRRSAADSVLRSLAMRFPDSAAVWKAYAAHFYDSDPIAADSAFRHAASIDTDDMVTLNNWAYLLAKNGVRLDEADSLIDKALSSDSTSPYFLDTKAWVLYQKGDYKGALEYAQKALKYAPNDADVNEHMGFILKALGKNDEAVQYFLKAMAADPSRTYLKKYIGQ